jgi:hypothetical protein
MQLVGTQNSHELVTISLDGVICWWSLDNLHTPIEKVSALCGAKKNVNISHVHYGLSVNCLVASFFDFI